MAYLPVSSFLWSGLVVVPSPSPTILRGVTNGYSEEAAAGHFAEAAFVQREIASQDLLRPYWLGLLDAITVTGVSR
jgi:hypothetical protein